MRSNFLTAALFLFSSFSLMRCTPAQEEQKKSGTTAVQVVGAMKNVMWKGELGGTIDLDTIGDKQHLYGLGPVEYLAGELLILDGKAYKSTVLTDTTMLVEETFEAKAPFFVYTHVRDWREITPPDSIQTMQQLEAYLDKTTQTSTRPFAFRVAGEVEQATIHIVNLPEGTNVSSPTEAHQGQVDYTLKDRQVQVVGFFSTEHQAVFTHHDTFLHMHLLTDDKTQMGHLDEVVFKPGKVRLYLPAE